MMDNRSHFLLILPSYFSVGTWWKCAGATHEQSRDKIVETMADRTGRDDRMMIISPFYQAALKRASLKGLIRPAL